MQNKRIKKKIAKINFCKSPVWHGAKIKTKDVRVQTNLGKFCDYGHVESERQKLKACPICGNSRRSGYYRCCPNCIWVLDWQDKVKKLVAQAGSVLASHDCILDVSFFNPLVARIRLEIKAYCDNNELTKQYRNECGRKCTHQVRPGAFKPGLEQFDLQCGKIHPTWRQNRLVFENGRRQCCGTGM